MSTEVKIIGAGPTGSLLALALANSGSLVKLYDSSLPSEIINSRRTYALTHSSRRIFQRLDLWDELNPRLTKFEKLVLIDSELNNKVIFKDSDLSYRNKNQGGVGWIVEHTLLMEFLLKKITESSMIFSRYGNDVDFNLDSNDLVIAADGSNSSARKYWNIDQLTHNYNQACITAKILVRNNLPYVAYEIFKKEGPLALLPLGIDSYQVIWCNGIDKCNQLVEYKDSYFLDKLSGLIPDSLEVDMLIDEPKVYPLRCSYASSYNRGRFLLVGESAHTIHPIGGQGLNLCWRDVESLKEKISKLNSRELILSKVTRRYNRNRLLDSAIMILITNLLLKFFGSGNKLVHLFRNLTLLLISKCTPIRKVILKIMTDGPLSLFTFK